MPPSITCNWFWASSAIDVGGGVEVLRLDLDAELLEVALLDRVVGHAGRDRADQPDANRGLGAKRG